MNQIGKIEFNFSAQNELFVQSLYGRWDIFFAQSIEHVADELLTRYATQSDYIEITRLDIEIGTLPEEEFEEKFPVIFREKMEEALLKCLHYPQQAQTSVRKMRHTESISELLFYFLLHGILPWNTPVQYRDIHILFMDVLKTEPGKFKQFLQTYGHYSSLQDRLVFQLGDQELEAGVRLLKSAESSFICSYVQSLINRYKQLESPLIPPAEHRNLAWRIVYSYLLSDAGSHYNRKAFLEYTIVRLAAGHNVAYDYLLQIITTEIEIYSSEIQPSTSLYFLLLELRKAWEDKQWQKVKFNSSEHSSVLLENEKDIKELLQLFMPEEKAFIISYAKTFNDFWNTKSLTTKAGLDIYSLQWSVIFSLWTDNPALKFNRHNFINEILKRIVVQCDLDFNLVLNSFSEYIQKAGLKNEIASIIYGLNIKNMDKKEERKDGERKTPVNSLSSDRDSLQTKSNEEVVYINNAGLILVAPFLPRLFDFSSFLNDRKFKGRDEQIRAIFLLQYLAYGKNKDVYPEHELILNKILVAMENDRPVPQSIELTEEECSLAESLLKSVLQHWYKLKNTSLTGLREGFLQREGKLEFMDDNVRLTVESKAYDILLDSIPWNFRTVKFPWMKGVMQVNWR